VEGADYRIEKRELIDWLSTWGEPLSDLKEDMHEDTVDPDTDTEPLGTGNYSMKIILKEFPPQHVPMCGHRVRLYYKGIAKKCGKCFGDHRPADCKQNRIPWINYVRDFMLDHPEVKSELYGRWARILVEKEAAGKIIETERVWTRRSLEGEEIRFETDQETEGEPKESATQEETEIHDSSSSESEETGQEMEEIQRKSEQIKAEFQQHKRECKIAGLDANPILARMEKSLLFSKKDQIQMEEQTKRLKKQEYIHNSAPEEEMKMFDKAKKQMNKTGHKQTTKNEMHDATGSSTDSKKTGAKTKNKSSN
jgi:hypothetical protein